MTQESTSPSGLPADSSSRAAQTRPMETFTDEEIDALETLAQFEIEHRRILAMQSLYYRRRKAGGAA